MISQSHHSDAQSHVPHKLSYKIHSLFDFICILQDIKIYFSKISVSFRRQHCLIGMSDREEIQEASDDLQVNTLEGLPDQDSACDDLNCPETLPLRDQDLDGIGEIDGADMAQENADKCRVTRPRESTPNKPRIG